MAETTIAPDDKVTPLHRKLPVGERQCTARPEGFTHCWHTLTPGFRNGPQSAIINAICCHCAPDYYRQTYLVPWNTPMEELVALEAQHGPLVRIAAEPKPTGAAPRILVPTNSLKQ